MPLQPILLCLTIINIFNFYIEMKLFIFLFCLIFEYLFLLKFNTDAMMCVLIISLFFCFNLFILLFQLPKVRPYYFR